MDMKNKPDRSKDEKNKETLLFGYITKEHGLKGDLRVRACDAGSRNLLDVKRVELAFGGNQRLYRVKKVVFRQKDFLLSLEGVDKRGVAEGFRGAEVRIFREDLPPLEEDEFFLADALGAEVFDEHGMKVGKLVRIEDNSSVPLLVIIGEDEELLLPARAPFIRDWEEKEKRLLVWIPENMPKTPIG